MANLAAFDLGFVLVHEGSLLVGVALVTNLILADRRAKLVFLKSAVRIVAIVALHQSFIHTMMERARELGADVHVAAVAEFR